MHHIFQYITNFPFFKIKCVKKGKNVFLCLIVYYPPLYMMAASSDSHLSNVV